MNITCLILNYNDFETTYKLISTIKNYKVFDKILIVDNCSTDDSYTKLYKEKNNKIDVISSEINGGYGYGNNYGIRYIKKNYNSKQVLICNPDVIFSEDMVYKLSEILSIDSQCAVASSKSINSKNEIELRSAWRLPTNKEYIFSASKIMHIILGNTEDFFYKRGFYENSGTYTVDCVSGSLLIVNIELMIKYFMYDERMFLFCEETLLGYKLKQVGLKTKISMDCCYLHNHSVSIDKSIKSKIERKRLMLNNRVIFFEKYKGFSKLSIYLLKVYFFGIVLNEDRLISLFKSITKRFK